MEIFYKPRFSTRGLQDSQPDRNEISCKAAIPSTGSLVSTRNRFKSSKLKFVGRFTKDKRECVLYCTRYNQHPVEEERVHRPTNGLLCLENVLDVVVLWSVHSCLGGGADLNSATINRGIFSGV